MIKFKEDTELIVVNGYDKENDNITDEINETFKAGEKVDANILNENETDYVDIQFANGAIALSVLRDLFDLID